MVNPEGRVEVVGLVSWGFKCDSVGMPSVYTKVQFFVDWIKENIQVNNLLKLQYILFCHVILNDASSVCQSIKFEFNL